MRIIFFLLVAGYVSSILAVSATAADTSPVHIELALQEGGEGTAIFRQIVDAFEVARPDIKIDIESDPRIGDQLHIRILEKNFPEITNGDFGGWKLIDHGDILSLNDALAAPPWNSSAGTWRESFLPGTLDRYTDGGQTFAVPLSYYIQSIWFNKALFSAHHWQPPRTWPELLALCQQIKESGIPPFAFQGRYPYYGQMFVDGAYYQIAGSKAFLEQQQLTPGSFDNAQMIQAITWTQTLATNYFQSGAMGMGHTEAQLQFFLGHTAMIPCGSWLKSEMAGKIPDGFELGTFNLPGVIGGKGDATALLATSGYFTVFSHSKHPQQAVEFLKFLTSPDIAALFCKQRDIPVAVRGVNESNLSPDLADLAGLIRDSHQSYGAAPGEGYPAMQQALSDELLAILTDAHTPSEAAHQLEAAAAIARQQRAHPEQVPIRHVVQPVIFLSLLVFGSLYAIQKFPWKRRKKISAPAVFRKLPRRMAMLFVGPSALLFLFFVLAPGMKSFAWSLEQWDGLTDAHFIGLRHFKYLLFSGDQFWIALANNLFIMLVIPALMVPLSLFLATCVSRGVRGTAIFRGAFLLPSVMGGVATTLLWMQLYDPQAGMVNGALAGFGKLVSDVGLSRIGATLQQFRGFAWLSQQHLYTALVPMSVWAGFGFNFILYLAAMQAVPTELYEAAELDGASHWQQFFVITIPLIWEVLTISAIFMIIGGMKAFESIWLLTNQQPSSGVQVIGTQMMQSMITDMNVGQATAIAVLLFVIVFVGSVAGMRLMQRETVEL